MLADRQPVSPSAQASGWYPSNHDKVASIHFPWFADGRTLTDRRLSDTQDKYRGAVSQGGSCLKGGRGRRMVLFKIPSEGV